MGFWITALVLAVVGLVIALIVQRKKNKGLASKLSTERVTNANLLASSNSYKSQVSSLKASLEAEKKKNPTVAGAAKKIATETVSKVVSGAARTTAPARSKSASTSRPQPARSSYRPSGSTYNNYNDGTDFVTGVALGAALTSAYDNSNDYGSSSSSSYDSGSSSSSYDYGSSSSSSSYDSGSSSSSYDSGSSSSYDSGSSFSGGDSGSF